VAGKGGRRVNMVKKCLYMHVNAKMKLLKLFQEGEHKRQLWRS
jgi:hypothetical protein